MIDRTARVPVNGTSQTIRICAEREGLPPLLIVQAGPGFPLLHEVPKFQRRLALESDFQVAYWEQRGCGNAPREDAERVSPRRQVDDLCAVLQWLKEEIGQPATVLAISLGGTWALQAVPRVRDCVHSLVAISPDADIPGSDASVASFLRARAARSPRMLPKLAKLGDPPYLDPAKLQARARLLADLGSVERGRGFAALLTETLFYLLRAYGAIGAVRALRNMNAVQAKMLPELASLDLFADPPRLPVPVHYAFGEHDPLLPADTRERLSTLIAPPGSTRTEVAGAGHMLHFDHPEVVRAIVVAAARRGAAVRQPA